MSKISDFIKPQSLDVLNKEEKKIIKKLKFIEIEIPPNLPNILYSIYKMNGKAKEDKLGGSDGTVQFKLRLWNDKEYGYALAADSRDHWYITSVLRTLKDKGHYIEFTTSSNSVYRIVPSRMSKKSFLDSRKSYRTK